MDVFALSSDYEGNPLSVMEAMAAGLPVVTTAAGGVRDLLESGTEGLIVQPGDVQGLSKAMSILLGNRELRKLMGKAAAWRARENFDVSAMARAYEEIYENRVKSLRRFNAEGVVRSQSASLRQA